MDGTSVALIVSSIVVFITYIWVVRAAFQQSLGWGFVVLLFSPISTIFLGIARWQHVKKPFLVYMTTFTIYAVLAMKMFTSYGGMDMLDTAYEMSQLAQMQQRGDMSEEEAQVQANAMLEKLSGQLGSAMDGLKNAGVISEAELAQVRQKMAESIPQNTGGSSADSISYDALRNRAIAEAEARTHEVALVDEDKEKSFQQIMEEKTVAQEKQRAGQADKIKAMHSKLSSKNQPELPQATINMSNISSYIGSELMVLDANNVTHTGIMHKTTKKYLQFYKELHGGRFEFQIARENVRNVRLSPITSK